MTKYYTMKECFDACGDNDIPFIKGRFNSSKRHAKIKILEWEATVEIRDAMSDQWNIQRAVPKILSAEEIKKRVHGLELIAPHGYTEHGVDRVIGIADKNGQLREWLRPEQVELREAVESLVNFFEAWSAEEKQLKRIYKALENLKPPTVD